MTLVSEVRVPGITNSRNRPKDAMLKNAVDCEKVGGVFVPAG
jgi:hypothetical protein